MVICLAWGFSLMVAMEVGGRTITWSGALEILLFALVALLPFMFVLWEYWLADRAMLQVVLFSNRNLASQAVVTCTNFASTFMSLNLLSVVYQALYDLPTWKAGQLVSIFIVGNVLGLLVSTPVLTRWRCGQLLILIGASLNVASAVGFVVCLQLNGKIAFMVLSSFLSGAGMGFSSQTIIAVAQSEFAHDPAQVANASSCMLLYVVERLSSHSHRQAHIQSFILAVQTIWVAFSDNQSEEVS